MFWQDYLTFGLLQSYLAERLPTWGTITMVAVMFWLGHALLLPDTFGPANPLAALAMLAMGALFALLRARLGTLHLLLALHLAFYFVFA
ncbi:type II CAAX prenyl endopeptidase Rce1 family protein [Pseudactinotalea sp. Z1739]|uniref:CPBP family glutamic-type intramembrane protease n=1 Tax=Pseudactinotalea sp. Z1739 TaxID=3413028 RepID=UPI003C7C7841